MSIKNIILAVFGIALVSAILFSVWQQKQPKDKVELKLQLKPGESHEMKVSSLQTITQKMNDKQRQVITRTDATIGLDVKNIDANGTMNVEFFYKAVKLEINSPPRYIEFDSANPKQIDPNDPNTFIFSAIAEVYSATIGSRLKMAVSPMGKTSEISGFDEIRAKIKENIKKRLIADINNANNEQVKEYQRKMAEKIAERAAQNYNSILSELVVYNTMEMMDCIIVEFPDRFILSDDKWHGKSQLNLGFMADANTTYTFRHCKEGRAYIDVITEFDMGKDFKTIEINALGKMKIRMSGVRKSSNIVDANTGLLRKSEAGIIFSGVEKIEPDMPLYALYSVPVSQTSKLNQPLPPSVLKIPVTIEGSITIELIK